MNEQALTLTSGETQLLSIVHNTDTDNDMGVVIIVGGPQYRVGSHRQFIQLARALAKQGTPCMRFDYSGMGDSQGAKASFEEVDSDIKAALDGFQQHNPKLKRFVLWGLCDAASASLMYAFKDSRVEAMVLLNPWLKNEQAKAKTMVKHYYLQRLMSKSFWKKLLSGKVNIAGSAKEASQFAKGSVKQSEVENASYQARMLSGFNDFNGSVCLILSGNDLTAKEFEQQAFSESAWGKIKSSQVFTHRLPRADHTFSTAQFKKEVEQITADFVHGLN